MAVLPRAWPSTDARACRGGFETRPYVDGYTDLFIYPGYKFKIADCLITNFHTPKSTLLMLVSAFSGIYNIKKAYKHAIDNEYRFFSYGDVCWLYKLIKSTIKS